MERNRQDTYSELGGGSGALGVDVMLPKRAVRTDPNSYCCPIASTASNAHHTHTHTMYKVKHRRTTN